MKKTYLLLLALSMAVAACSSPSSEAGGAASQRPVESARYVYNPATNSYEWERGDRVVSGAYQQ